jgi:hypothetical protein
MARGVSLIFKSHWIFNLEAKRLEEKEDFYFKYRGLISKKYYILCYIFVNVFHLVCGLIVHFALPLDSVSCLEKQRYLDLAYSILYTLLMIPLVLYLLSLRDPYFLKFELGMTLITCAPPMLIFIIDGFYNFLSSYVLTYSMYLIAYEMGSIWSVYFPLLMANGKIEGFVLTMLEETEQGSEQEKLSLEMESILKDNSDSSFRLVFSDPILLNSFKTFSVSQWFVENVLFCVDVQRFKTCSNDLVPSLALNIYNNYIDTRSILCLNISYSVREDIVKSIQNHHYHPTMFDEALIQIEELLKVDGFIRWKSSTEFKVAFVEWKKIRRMSTKKSESSFSLHQSQSQEPLDSPIPDPDPINMDLY